MARKSKRARRGRGEGSIYQRKDGRWVAEASFGYDSEGKPKKRTQYAATKEEAQEKLREMQGQTVAVDAGKAKRQTVTEYLNDWLKGHEIRPSTKHRYDQVIRTYITPHIGGVQFAKVSPAQIKSLYVILKKGNSKRAPSMAHEVLSAAYNVALADEVVPANPLANIKKPARPKREYVTLDVDQCLRFFQASRNDRFHALFVVAACSGAREGELLGLQWGDIDLKSGTVSLARTLQDFGKTIQIGDPKTAKGRRMIYLPPIAVEALEAHRKRMLVDGLIAKPVFCDSEGNWMRRSNLARRHFKPALVRAKLPDMRFHDLRHSCATILLQLREHPAIVSAILGHSSVTITLNTYSHVTPNLGQEATARIGDAMAGAFKKKEKAE